MTNYIQDRYFDWLMDIVCCDYYEDNRKIYSKLLKHLLHCEYRWTIPKDENRYYDGLELRDIFLDHNPDLIGEFEYEFSPSSCSILEVLIALSQRAEVIMDNDIYGDRTSRWFWEMVRSLRLDVMNNRRFDSSYVDDVIFDFLNHDYEPDGRGGLFTIPGTIDDLRQVELWYQMCWYLNYIIDIEGE